MEDPKRYAREHDTALTHLVSEYLQRLPAEDDPLARAPIVRRLSGTLSPHLTREEYRKHLEEKYGGRG